MRVNPNLATWLKRAGPQRPAGQALVIGCGPGDDAEALQTIISEACIAWCRRRFPKSAVDYVVADLFAPPPNWHRAFALVVEAYTLQVLPREIRPTTRAIAASKNGLAVFDDGNRCTAAVGGSLRVGAGKR
jgi:hypothetical protein